MNEWTPTRTVNGHAGRKREVGFYLLVEDTTFVKQDFETAAWWQKFEVKAGRYPIYQYQRQGRDTFGVDFPALVTDEWFGPYWQPTPLPREDVFRKHWSDGWYMDRCDGNHVFILHPDITYTGNAYVPQG